MNIYYSTSLNLVLFLQISICFKDCNFQYASLENPALVYFKLNLLGTLLGYIEIEMA